MDIVRYVRGIKKEKQEDKKGGREREDGGKKGERKKEGDNRKFDVWIRGERYKEGRKEGIEGEAKRKE